jgi:hypothetical protein
MATTKEPRFSNSSETLNGDHTNGDVAERGPSFPPPPQGGIYNYLKGKVDANRSTAPLAAFSFMTGFM